MKRYWRHLRSALLIICLMAVTSGVLDLWRAPSLPESAWHIPVNPSGETLATLSEQQPILVYVWATWCAVCKITTPSVAALAGEGIPVQTVALRSGSENQLRQLQAARGWPFATLADPDGRLAAQWDIAVTPTFLVVYRAKVIFSTSGWTSQTGLRLRLWAARI